MCRIAQFYVYVRWFGSKKHPNKAQCSFFSPSTTLGIYIDIQNIFVYFFVFFYCIYVYTYTVCKNFEIYICKQKMLYVFCILPVIKVTVLMGYPHMYQSVFRQLIVFFIVKFILET